MIGSSEGQGLCAAIAPAPAPVMGMDCVPLQPDLLTYLQSAIVGAGTLLTYGIGGAVVNKLVGLFYTFNYYFSFLFNYALRYRIRATKLSKIVPKS